MVEGVWLRECRFGWWSTRDSSALRKRGCMSRKVIIAINIGILVSGYLVFVLTGQAGAGLSTTIGLSLGSFFWLRGRKRK